MRIKAFILLLFWVVVANAIPEPVLMPELNLARSKWESYGSENYAFVISNTCSCPSPVLTGPILIRVQDDKIRRALYIGERRDGYSPRQAVRRRTPLRTTVPGLFDLIEKRLRKSNSVDFKIKYDAVDGHPVHIEYTEPGAGGGKNLITVKEFKRL